MVKFNWINEIKERLIKFFYVKVGLNILYS